MTSRGWEHFAHGADIGVRGFGETAQAAFEEGAKALMAVIVEPDTVRHRLDVEVCCRAPDLEILFFDWLNALVYEMTSRHMLFSAFTVTIAERVLTATAGGEPIDPSRHRMAVEVKGATFTELRVIEQNGRWLAQCVVDV